MENCNSVEAKIAHGIFFCSVAVIMPSIFSLIYICMDFLCFAIQVLYLEVSGGPSVSLPWETNVLKCTATLGKMEQLLLLCVIVLS